MPEMHDFEWFLERLEPARWEEEAVGHRSFLGNCPVCGGHDPLHVTEQNGKALIKCFACDARYTPVVEALEAAPEPDTTAIPIVRRKRRTAAEVAESDEPPPAPVSDPIQWYADYCGVTREHIESLGIIATTDGWVRHTWPVGNVAKDRRPNSGDRRWVPKGANQPRLWPAVPDVLPAEIWLAEGETDVICLRADGVPDTYTAGSASQPLSGDEMEHLKRRGVERIVVAYDNDKAGRKAAKETIDAAREVGILAVNAILGDPLLGGPKDWRERHLSGDTSRPLTDAEEAAENVWLLADVQASPNGELLLNKIHPTDHTILFGDGGTGKGVVAAWWVARLTKEHHMRVLVLDYEAHASHEWRPRVERFGGNLNHVFIMQPSEAIWDAAGAVNEVIARNDIDLVVVDSVTYACLGVEVEKSATAAQYSVAIAQFHRPVLSLAHVTKTDLNPAHPFGSIFWSNGARITISIHRSDENDHASPREMHNRKTNQAAPFKPVSIPWDWVDNELPTTLKELEVKAVGDALVMAVMQVSGWQTMAVTKLFKAITESGLKTTYDRVGEAKKKALESDAAMQEREAQAGTLAGVPKRRRRDASPAHQHDRE